ncbi:MAG: DEAD/DEAH box helicase, partial [Spirochaetaceae bacterium]|nr:DEAD/DEAH box helicase [Spirochaetaceae bacterium]
EDKATYSEVESLLIYPMKEVILDDERIGQLEKEIKKQHDGKGIFKNNAENLLGELYVNKQAEGEELFYGMCFGEEGGACSIFDYISDETTLIMLDFDRLANAQESFRNEYSGLYKRAVVEGRDVPLPEDMLYDFAEINGKCKHTIRLRSIHGDDALNSGRIIFETEPPRSFFGNINYLKEQLEGLIKDDWSIYVFADSANQALRINEILRDFPSIEIVPLSISSGFGIPEEKILVIQENEIFGRRRHIPKSVKYVKSAVIDTFVELNPGDYVVHVNYGIGLFKGIERVRAMGNERDYIKIEYADEESVCIPIEQVNLVQRYIGNEGDAPKLDRLGSKSWENRKNKVKKSVEDIAERLIQLYSKRKAARGFPFPKDNEFQTAFEAAFPYEETDDQLTCFADVKADMERPQPMDWLICGDVGYGKTEIAMRAAFKAVIGGKQVAFLAPTTILAEQHYENCLERFEHFPVRIAHLSRFVAPKEQKQILEKLKNGEIDIIIGTHRIIQKDVVFKDLGLMIIDEEQRFGVKDKERLKELKTSVDSLAMSATPIPRTLHMSLLKIRDMSILNTPPQNRQPIETIIDAYNDDRVA